MQSVPMMRFCALASVLALLVATKADGNSPQSKFDLTTYENTLEEMAKSNGDQELVKGVAVNKLLALRNVDGKKCSRADLFSRWFTCEMLRPEESARLYCIHYLDQAARLCARETLGRNPFHTWATLRKMSENERTLWEGISKLAPGKTEAMTNQLTYGLVPEGDKNALEPRYGFVIDSEELLGREQLMDMLRRVQLAKVRTTLAILSRAKDKETTEVVEGVTVADLVKMNDVSQRFCETPDEIIKRNRQCLATQGLENVRYYCRSAIIIMGSKCLEGFDKSNYDKWWLGVQERLMMGLLGFKSREGKTVLDLYLLEDPATMRAQFDYVKSEDMRREA